MPAQPNIVIMMAEQFTPFADPNEHPLPLDAPALKRLAGESVRFRHTHCNAPVCGPSRATFLTGLYACNHETYDNGSIIPPHVPTFAHLLTAAGYQTAMCGRMHIHGLDQHRGFESRLCSELINPLPVCEADMPGALEPIRPIRDAAPTEYIAEFSDSPIYQHDNYVTQRTCDFLMNSQSERDGRPFLLVSGYFASHTGFKPCAELKPLYEKYLKRDLPLPDFDEQAYERLPEHMKRLTQYADAGRKIFDPAYHHHQMAWYFARVEYYDMQIQRVIQALEDSGLADSTYLMVTADHGESMGYHGHWGKMNFYEPAQRVPLYVRKPTGRESRVVDDAVSLTDFLPTLCDIAGADITTPTDGESFLPLVEDADARREDSVIFSEYHGYLSPSGMYMVLKNGIKYCHYPVETDELYDLNKDPQELNNLIDNPAYATQLADLKQELASRVDVAYLEARIQRYNAQRAASSLGQNNSPVIGARIRALHQAFRDEYNEPWWDGGQYMSAHEPASVNPLAKQT